MHDPSDPGAITHVAGIEVGHHSDSRRPTGCTVVMARAGAVAGVDVRGAAPGTRDPDASNDRSTADVEVRSGGGPLPPQPPPARSRRLQR